MAELARADADNDILVEAKKRLNLAADNESSNRTEALTDLRFGNGDQWPVDVSRDRETDGRPCLTVNVTDAMVRRVCNSLRENRPRIKCHPVGSGADVNLAKTADGVIRHIETASGADHAYDTGVESAVRGGWGYWRVGSKYIDDKSFDQDLTIEAIQNPFTVYMDPASRAPDGSDMDWCLVSEWVSREEYAQRYGDDGMPYSRLRTALSTIGNAFSFMGAGDEISDWSKKEQLRICEYWRVTKKLDTLYMLADGSTKFKDDMPSKPVAVLAGLQVAQDKAGKPISRQVLRRSVEWYLLSGDRVLDRRDWPGKWIPIIACYGRQTDLNGRIIRKGMIRDMRDPARSFNYSETSKTEVYALQPKAPWLGAEGFMEGHEAAWRDANRKPIVALEYKPTLLADGTTLAPPPVRQEPPPVASGFAEWSQSNLSNFLFVTGMPNEPDADKKGEVVSGIALHKRQGLSDISHFDFYDNQVRSLRHTGHVIIDLLPYFYDTQRVQRIINPDGTPDLITINERSADGLIKNNLITSKFDIVIDTGPGYQTAREEAADAMLQLMATPLGEMTAKVAGDVVVRAMNFPDADTIADRLAAMIPGANIDKDSDLPPKAQMIIAGLQSQLKNANQQIMAAHFEIEAKHGLEKIRQDGQTRRVQLQESAETARTEAELHVKVHDVNTSADVKREDTHVKAVTAHDVAEIQAASRLLNTNTEAEHNRAAAKDLLEAGEQSERRDV